MLCLDANANNDSRTDRYFGDPLPFNATVWKETLGYFPDDKITVQQVADARQGRIATSKKTNPEHKLSALGAGFSWGECATFFEILADGTTGTVDKKYIRYWIGKHSPIPACRSRCAVLTNYFAENERLPTEIGWKRRPTEMPSSERVKYSQMLEKAGGESTGLSGLSGLSGGTGGGSGLSKFFGKRGFAH